MNAQKICNCDFKHRRILLYKESKKGRLAQIKENKVLFDSPWSTIICLNCGHKWKSQFKWVDHTDRITEEEKRELLNKGLVDEI